MENKTNIPMLRFPEFSGEWEEDIIEKLILNYRLGGNYNNSENPTPNPLIKMGNIDRGYIKLNRLEYIPLTEIINEEDQIKYGDLFFNTRNTLDLVGKVAIWRNELDVAYYNSNLMRITFENNFFMNYRFNSRQGIKALRRLATGTTSVAAIYSKDFLKIKLYIPQQSEQQKIASFLSAVDKKIEQLQQKKELLEQYKKGMMQKLFSQQLRFKDDNGNDFPEWEGYDFGNLYSFKVTNSLSRDRLNYSIGNVYNIHYGDIHTKLRAGFIFNNETIPFINKEVDIHKINKDNYCKEGDLVIADASENYDDIGKTIELIELNNKEVLAGLHTFLARPNLNKIKIGFGRYLMQSENVRKQMKIIAQGTKVLSISTNRVATIKIKAPSLAEQSKITDFLTAIDVKIEVVAKELEGAKSFKKGLLQQMFV